MQKLVEGIHHFQNDGFNAQRDLFERLARGQHPDALFITCSDSRINPNLITNTNPGDLFIVRNVGNMVPPHGTPNNAEAAAVEFAVEALGVKDIIVCGHTHCGAMKGLLNPGSLGSLPAVKSWLVHGEAAQRIVQENYTHLQGDALVTAMAEENVLVQLEHLHTLPIVAARLAAKKINLHAWMYKIENGRIFTYDIEAKQFVSFSESEPLAVG